MKSKCDIPFKAYTIRGYTPYVNGIVGQDFHLSFWQRLKILFCDGVTVVLLNEKLKKEKEK